MCLARLKNCCIMGNENSKVPSIQEISTKLKIPSMFKLKKPGPTIPTSKKCRCDLYAQTNHCCMQTCLKNEEMHSRLQRVWIFTDEHFDILRGVLLDIGLQDVAQIIEAFLEGALSTSEEFNLFCHGISEHSNKPCTMWLNTRNRSIHIQILGGQKAGKTSLALKCCKNEFNEYLMDEDINMCLSKTIRMQGNYNSTHQIRLSLFHDVDTFDLRGREKEIIYVFCIDPLDPDHFEQFEEIERQKLEILKNDSSFSKEHDNWKCAFIVAATKCDLKNEKYARQSDRMIRSCKIMNMPFVEVSAKNGINIDLFLKTCVFELWVQSQTGCSC